jgi:hypothetical protein
MSTNELITYIRRIDYNQATLPHIIRDSYEEKNNRFDKIMEDFSELSPEQFQVYRSVLSFMVGIHIDIKKILDTFFIKDISDIILSKLHYYDYPKDDTKVAVLQGGAGTGKTYLVQKIIERLEYINYNVDDKPGNIFVLAPTNKALKVIKNNISHLNVTFQTISRFLEQDICYTKEGKVVYKTRIKTKKSIKYVIIDEASMISRNNFRDLYRYIITRYNVKVLFVGDINQLPPVKELFSHVFDIPRKYTLKNIIRTKNSDLIKLYQSYCDDIPESENFRYVDSFDMNAFDIEQDKIISYSNKSVDYYNKIVRDHVFNNPDDDYVIGEKLIFKTTVKINNIYYYANDELTIHDIRICKFKIENKKYFPDDTFFIYQIKALNEYKTYVQINVVHKRSLRRFTEYFNKISLKIRDKSLWNLFYSLKYSIDTPVRYSYALTVYKSQGSTFRNVYVDVENIKMCARDTLYQKSMYTAVTRAKNKIFA